MLNIKDRLGATEEARRNMLRHLKAGLICYKSQETSNERIYIVSTSVYARQGIYKISKTKTFTKRGFIGYPVSHVRSRDVKVIKEYQVQEMLC